MTSTPASDVHGNAEKWVGELTLAGTESGVHHVVMARGEPPRCVQCRKRLPYAWRAWLCAECAKGTR